MATKPLRMSRLRMELRDWMDDHRRMLANLRQFEASAEHWLQFELGGLLLDRWESVCRLPHSSAWVWIEASHPVEPGRADIAIGPKTDNGKVRWERAALIETKHIAIGPRAIIGLSGVRDDLEKRASWGARQSFGLTLCFHRWGEEEQRKEGEIIAELKRVRRAARGLGLRAIGDGPDPFVSTRRRGENCGFLSLGLWGLK